MESDQMMKVDCKKIEVARIKECYTYTLTNGRSVICPFPILIRLPLACDICEHKTYKILI